MKTSTRTISISGPSGVGKNTVINLLLTKINWIQKTQSVTTRARRDGDLPDAYHYCSVEEFQAYIESDTFIEYEEVYSGVFYGTLRSELVKIQACGNTPLFEIDVTGAMDIKRELGDDHLTIFLAPPSLEELESRLRDRKSDSDEAIQARINKAGWELRQEHRFDRVVVNDDLDVAVDELAEVIGEFVLTK